MLRQPSVALESQRLRRGPAPARRAPHSRPRRAAPGPPRRRADRRRREHRIGHPRLPEPRGAAAAEAPDARPGFLCSAALRRRYWARASVGWERFRLARPGAAHAALARLEAHGVVTHLITQNVDRLHHAAGSRQVIELHGALAEVVCLACGRLEARDEVHARTVRANGAWISAIGGRARRRRRHRRRRRRAFVAPACGACGGDLRPRVVFFGENVPRPVVDAAFAASTRPTRSSSRGPRSPSSRATGSCVARPSAASRSQS